MGTDYKGRSRKTYCNDRNVAWADRRWGWGVVRVRPEDLLAWSPHQTQKNKLS